MWTSFIQAPILVLQKCSISPVLLFWNLNSSFCTGVVVLTNLVSGNPEKLGFGTFRLVLVSRFQLCLYHLLSCGLQMFVFVFTCFPGSSCSIFLSGSVVAPSEVGEGSCFFPSRIFFFRSVSIMLYAKVVGMESICFLILKLPLIFPDK